jgi:hypothetical protein
LRRGSVMIDGSLRRALISPTVVKSVKDFR